jgi:hypothetical protein
MEFLPIFAELKIETGNLKIAELNIGGVEI